MVSELGQMLPAAGQRFGPYEILALLGGGGMGVVYRAWDERLHREVAVKLLQEEYRAPGMRERFLLEARAASALAHPHICTVFDMGEQDGEPYLVMELLQGMTLKQLIGQRACTAEEMVRWGAEIAEALAAAHARGIVHRDIKPANIFLQSQPGGDRSVKIVDFGLAKVSMALRSGGDSRALELTSAGFTVGTLAYMSPEQARGEALDARTDLFSLGAVLYEMATRRTPFRGATTALTFQALLGEAPDPLRRWNATVPRELERVIGRLLCKERRDRYGSAAEVEDALRKLLTRGDGEWLRRVPTAAVPLVPATDPVARRAAPRRTAARQEVARQEARAVDPLKKAREVRSIAAPVRKASADEGILRPQRLPKQESGPRETAFGVERTREQSDPQRSDRSGSGAGRTEEVGRGVVLSSVAAEAAPPAAAIGQEDAAAGVAADAATTLRVPEVVVTRAAEPAAARVAEMARQEEVPDPLFRRTPRGRGSSGRVEIAALAEPAVAIAEPEPEISGRRRLSKGMIWAISLVAFAACVLVLLLVVELRAGELGTVVLGPKDAVLLGPIENRTGEAELDGVVEEALRLTLRERSQLHWMGADAFAAGTRLAGGSQVQNVAQALGARAYVAGELAGSPGHRTIRLDVIEASSNDRLASVSEEAGDDRALPAAAVRLAEKLRAKMGETSGRDGGGTVAREMAGANAAALHGFAKGEQARADGDLLGAAAGYREAAAAAPQFALAELRLAQTYARAGAELPAAESAARAQAGAAAAGDRVQWMVRAEVQLLRDGDVATAISTARRGAALRPNEKEGLILLARVMRESGRMTEALLAAEKATSRDAYDAEAYDEAALAMIGLGRAGDAAELRAKAKAKGVRCECGAVLAAQLGAAGVDAVAGWEGFSAGKDRALVSDDAGDLAGGLELWRSAVGRLRGEPEMVSAAAGMLAMAAADRALAGRCGEGVELAHEASLLAYGREAAFRIALTEAMCRAAAGSESSVALARLTEGSHAAAVAQRVELLRAAAAVGEGRGAQAAETMEAIPAEHDAAPLEWYLRGLSLAMAGQRAAAASAFSETANEHGYALETGSTVAPLAAARLKTH